MRIPAHQCLPAETDEVKGGESEREGERNRERENRGERKKERRKCNETKATVIEIE